jgi:voltage-gated potassium channel
LNCPEALYFPVVTLSTIGNGDIVPVSSVARTLAAREVVLGVLLLLFGVSEILEYSRERRARRRAE